MDNSLAKLLSEWLAFAQDVQPNCAAGDEWLTILRNSTKAELQKLTSSQNSGKPLVSGSLPQNVTVAEIIDVIENLIQNYHNIDADGEPTAPILDIVEAWIKARELLCHLRK